MILTMKFTDLDFQPHPHYKSDGVQAKHFFPNGYGVSVVRFPGSYGYDQDLYEVAVIQGNEDDFELFGWLFNHTLVATLATLSETETFGILNPVEYNAKKGEWNLSLGRKSIKQASSTVKSMGDPTGLWNTTGQKMSDAYSNFALYLEDKDNAYWKKDTGPYWFQKSGEPKFWKDIFSIFGFTGTQVSPVEAAEKEMYKQRR